jgi:hypothetical protein
MIKAAPGREGSCGESGIDHWQESHAVLSAARREPESFEPAKEQTSTDFVITQKEPFNGQQQESEAEATG